MVAKRFKLKGRDLFPSLFLKNMLYSPCFIPNLYSQGFFVVFANSNILDIAHFLLDSNNILINKIHLYFWFEKKKLITYCYLKCKYLPFLSFKMSTWIKFIKFSKPLKIWCFSTMIYELKKQKQYPWIQIWRTFVIMVKILV